MILRTLIALLVLLVTATPAVMAQTGFGFQIANGVFLDDRFDDIRIGAVARKHIEDYLTAEHARLCKKKGEKPPVCIEQKPFYKGAALRAPSQPLPAELQKKIGFVYPGTQYRQIGFSIYLVGQPRPRIFDVVSLWNDGWN